jgi:Holliday junction resolvase RusA-like endonuclease
MAALEVAIDNTPPSLNVVGMRSDWRTVNRWKKAWQKDLELLFLAEQLPRPLTRVEVTAVLRFPQRRRRDEGNYRALLEKACGDALTNGGWLADDDVDRFSFGRLSVASERGPKRTVLTLTFD